MIVRLCRDFWFCSVLCAGLAAQTSPTWTQLLVLGGPVARWGHGMAYDAARGEVVIFGGRTVSTGYLADTWTWNGSLWRQHMVPGPSARGDLAMAYDRARQRTILFGGTANMADTWEWDGMRWTQLQPAQSPVARRQHAMTYDEARQRIVLFGGERDAGTLLSDTWEWDGNSWIPRFTLTVPPSRHTHAMAHDAARRETVLFGGVGQSGALADTWVWNGTDWQMQSPAARPGARYGTGLAYHPRRQVVVLFSGSSGNSDTWYWDQGTWLLASQLGPTSRSGHGVVFDEAREHILMFGGMNVPAQTWQMTIPGITGRLTAFGQGCGPTMVLTSRIGSVPRVGATYHAELQNVPPAATGAVMLVGLSKDFLGPFPLPIGLDFLGMSGCSLYHDLFLSTPMPLASGAATWSVGLPPLLSLAGLHFYLQAAVGLPGANAAGLVVSHAADALIGN